MALRPLSDNESDDQTSGPTNPTALYISRAKKFGILTKEEEEVLGNKAMNGCHHSIKKLAEHNLRLVLLVINRSFINYKAHLDELIQSGNVGLMKAAKTYKPDKGRFSTWAGKIIKYAIYDSLPEMDLVKTPRHVQKKYKKQREEVKSFESGEQNTFAQKTQKRRALEKTLNKIHFQMVSLDDPIGNGKESTLGDTIPCEGRDPFIILLAKESLDEVNRYVRKMIVALMEDKSIEEWEVEVFVLYNGLLPNTDPLNIIEISKKHEIDKQDVCNAVTKTQKTLVNRFGISNDRKTIRKIRESALILEEITHGSRTFNPWIF